MDGAVSPLILAVTGREQIHARQLGLRAALLVYRLGPRLLRENGAAGSPGPGPTLVLCDAGFDPDSCRPEVLAEDTLAEAHRMGACGLLLDFTGPVYPPLLRLCGLLDEACAARRLELCVHLPYAEAAPHARLLVSTDITAGSLEQRMRDAIGRYGSRLAAELVPVSLDFPLPCASQAGQRLSPEQRDALAARLGAQPYFSTELCARYFTYMGVDRQPHFVLFDDASTLCAKLRLLEALEVFPVFALWAEVCDLLPEALRLWAETPVSV